MEPAAGPTQRHGLRRTVADAAMGKSKMALRELGIDPIGDATEEERQALLDLTIDKLLLVGPTAIGKVVSKPTEAALRR
jgi:hypothetical protein